MDQDEITGTLKEWSLSFVEAGSEEFAMIPEQWRPIVLSIDPETRRRAALSLWNKSFLDLIPDFAAGLRTRCADVRVCISDGAPVLVYVLETDSGARLAWVGCDPRTFVEPRYWEAFPEPLQVFLREVHAGFTAEDKISFGVAHPIHIVTLADLAGFPEGIPGWQDEADIPSTRLLQITTDGGILRYCLSPDLASGEIALVYEGDIDPQRFGPELDELMLTRFRSQD